MLPAAGVSQSYDTWDLVSKPARRKEAKARQGPPILPHPLSTQGSLCYPPCGTGCQLSACPLCMSAACGLHGGWDPAPSSTTLAPCGPWMKRHVARQDGVIPSLPSRKVDSGFLSPPSVMSRLPCGPRLTFPSQSALAWAVSLFFMTVENLEHTVSSAPSQVCWEGELVRHLSEGKRWPLRCSQQDGRAARWHAVAPGAEQPAL